MITDEGRRRLPKCLEIVNLLVSVSGPQSSHCVHIVLGKHLRCVGRLQINYIIH